MTESEHVVLSTRKEYRMFYRLHCGTTDMVVQRSDLAEQETN